MLEVRTFGGLSLRVDGRPVKSMGSNKAEALLVYLLLEGGQHSREELAALFWPESSQERASTSLRVALSVLRKKLGDTLDISRASAGVRPEAGVYLDVFDLQRRLAGGKLEGAVELYRGDFLLGFQVRESQGFEAWRWEEQENLRRRVIGALHTLLLEALEAEDHARGSAFAARLLALDPLDERACFQSVLLLALDGQRAAALAQYEKCRQVLFDELGVEPPQALQELHTCLLTGESLERLKPALPSCCLPLPQTSFIGRQAELEEIAALIREPACRLLTLVGPGGSGKTRLALKAANEARWCFPDGACFVPLEAADSPDYLIPAVAAALDFTIDSFINAEGLKPQLLEYLRKRSLLLVLDGCESLSGRIGDLPVILENAPRVKVLATSRQRLELQAEYAFPVAGFHTPQTVEEARDDQQEAVRLFRERAGQARTDFHFSAVDFEPVARICRMVDGMPLGIELAAAWTSSLSPREIADETEKSLDFLTSGMADIPQKHHSLRAVFDSSWSLLPDELRETFRKISVFRGGFDRQAALQVAGAGPELLAGLLDRSLLLWNEAGVYSIHSLLRRYAAEKLSEAGELESETRERFCSYYLDFLSQREADLMGPRMLKARDEIRMGMDNLRAAVNWAVVHWTERPVRKMLFSLMCFYAIHGWQEGVLAFRDIAQVRKEKLLADGKPEPEQDPVFICIRIHEAFFRCNLGEIAESEVISRDCLSGLQQPGLESELSECLQNLGVNASYRGEYEYARDVLEKAILLGRECGHVFWPTYLLWLGYLYFLMGEYEQGLLSLQKSYDLFDRKGTLWGNAFALSKMGLAADGFGDHARAKTYHQEALSVFERLESQAGKGYALSRMSMSAYFMGQYPEAARLAQEGFEAFDEIGHRWGICTSLCALGFASLGLGDLEKARRSFRSALKESRPDQIVPQSMYSLIGLACVLAQEGHEHKAHELMRFVGKHPETPDIYLSQAERWIGDPKEISSREPGTGSDQGKMGETLDELVARVLG